MTVWWDAGLAIDVEPRLSIRLGVDGWEATYDSAEPRTSVAPTIEAALDGLAIELGKALGFVGRRLSKDPVLYPLGRDEAAWVARFIGQSGYGETAALSLADLVVALGKHLDELEVP